MYALVTEIKHTERFILVAHCVCTGRSYFCGTNTLLCFLPIPVFSDTKNNCCKKY